MDLACVLFVLSCVAGSLANDKDAKVRYKEETKLKHTDEGPDVHKGTEHIDVPVKVTPIFERRLYPKWGEEAGDHELPHFVNDISTGLQLKKPIIYLGKEYDTIYVLSNGAVTFDKRILPFTNRILDTDQPMIAPYWVRNDHSLGGRVFYREELYDKLTLRRGESEIRFHFNVSAKVDSAFIVTWVDMQPRLKHGRTINRKNWNQIQLVILNSESGTFANIIYSNIGWGARAVGGFSDGNGTKWEVPRMGSLYPMHHGNTGVPGEWMFMVHRDSGVVRCRPGYSGLKCDERCGLGRWGWDCASECACAPRLCALDSARCLTEEEESAEHVDWAAIIGPLNRRRRRFAERFLQEL